MRYQIRHLTRYDYSGQATLSHNEARVLPRNLPWQKCLNSEWQISPKPVRLRERTDFHRDLTLKQPPGQIEHGWARRGRLSSPLGNLLLRQRRRLQLLCAAREQQKRESQQRT